MSVIGKVTKAKNFLEVFIMKKVAVICAAGKQGKLLVNEAVSRGYEVTGFVRGSDKVENAKAKTVVKDLFDLAREDLIGFDVVIDAFGA